MHFPILSAQGVGEVPAWTLFYLTSLSCYELKIDGRIWDWGWLSVKIRQTQIKWKWNLSSGLSTSPTLHPLKLACQCGLAKMHLDNEWKLQSLTPDLAKRWFPCTNSDWARVFFLTLPIRHFISPIQIRAIVQITHKL